MSAKRALKIAIMPDGRACLHGTAIAIGNAALILVGPSGVGKSGVAAQMMAMGATLVSDDLVIVSTGKDGLFVSAPEAAPPAIELRGFGIVDVSTTGPSLLCAILMLGHAVERFPEVSIERILGAEIRILRHPTTPDIAAKARLWLMAQHTSRT